MVYRVLILQISFSVTAYEGDYRDHLYGLLHLSAIDWLVGNIMMLGISKVRMGIAVGILYIALHRTSRHWWIWVAGIGVVVIGIS
ncbi:hypothetical protein [Undibacterium sp. SXout20W]|uniref:hypothetical protein n=1 Tax=Undibacterium sp. SXout20W TaxID=3413051 RepID=UPI003BEFD972